MTNYDFREARQIANDSVGFYGCNRNGEPGVVRVESTTEEKRKRKSRFEIDCPICGEHHEVKVAWRAKTDYDQGKKPDLEVEA